MVSEMVAGSDVVGSGVLDLAAVRTVVLASADAGLRQRLRASLTGLRWQVREAGGGAEAMAQLEASRPEALLVDSWLPDLEVGEFAGQIRLMYPGMELMRVDGSVDGAARSPRRNELLHALREAQDGAANDTAAWAAAPVAVPKVVAQVSARQALSVLLGREELVKATNPGGMLPEMVGTSEPMQELARLIRLVAPRSTTVLIEGETGTGKEVVARALQDGTGRG